MAHLAAIVCVWCRMWQSKADLGRNWTSRTHSRSQKLDACCQDWSSSHIRFLMGENGMNGRELVSCGQHAGKNKPNYIIMSDDRVSGQPQTSGLVIIVESFSPKLKLTCSFFTCAWCLLIENENVTMRGEKKNNHLYLMPSFHCRSIQFVNLRNLFNNTFRVTFFFALRGEQLRQAHFFANL